LLSSLQLRLVPEPDSITEIPSITAAGIEYSIERESAIGLNLFIKDLDCAKQEFKTNKRKRDKSNRRQFKKEDSHRMCSKVFLKAFILIG